MASVAAVAVMLLVGALWNLTSLCERVADAEWERDKLLHDPTNVPALIAEVRRLTAALATARREGAEEMRERAANVCERMVVGGCAWSEEQAAAGRALLDAAGNIRALPLDAPGGAPDCTGITAQWCPRCGDCTCPALHEGGDPGERTLDDPACPLHAPSSPHGDAPGGAT